MSEPAAVTICVITFRRPHGLRRLLGALAHMMVDPAAVTLRVVVVDNDADGPAASVVEELAGGLPWPVRYGVEPARGIPMARNHALRLALADAPDFVAWMDDDEEPSPNWLTDVLATQTATGADVVMGPGVPEYEPGIAPWLRRSGLLAGPRFVTGREFPFFYARTSGVLVRTSTLPPEGFDERMALTGGSDRVHFTRIHRNGGRFVWDDRAVMHDHVPASRGNVRWLLKRWYRVGVTRSLTLLYLDEPGTLRRARRVLGGLAQSAKGVALTVVAVPAGRAAMLDRWRLVMLGLGASAGALGVRYREYRSIHGV